MTASASDAIEEIRKAELNRRRRKKLIIGGSSSVLLVLLVAAVVATVYTSSKSSSSDSPSSDAVQTSSKSVEMICTTTDYKSTCQKSLSKAVKSNDPDPKELVKAAISVVFDAIGAAFNRTQQIKTTDAQISGAMEDCRELFNSSKDELHTSLNTIVDRGVDQIPEQADNIRTWLSAVMAYQQTCVDGFPKGELKAKMEEAMKQAREMTSNALAIVGQAAKYLGMLSGDGVIGRRLLEEEEAAAEEELPEWVPEGDRRMVKEEKYEVKLKANVTVAKDGSGQFKSISAALENMPKKYKGRYVCI